MARARLTLAALSLMTWSTACTYDTGDRGTVLYDNNCVPCHMPAGDGKQGVGAPAIAGLPEWYVRKQIDMFRDGTRGKHFDDIAGMRMRPMSRTLFGDDEVAAVSGYVAKMPKGPGADTMDGDPVAGKARYAVCVTCHGANGEGLNDVMGQQGVHAPPLQGSDDWYMYTQINNFKAGIRGVSPSDAGGALMVPMAKTLPDDQSVKDVVAYIRTLK